MISESESIKTSKPPTLRSISPSDPHPECPGFDRKGKDRKKRYQSMFHVVFMINAKSSMVDEWNDRLYHCVLEHLSMAMKWEQERSNWVYKESIIMRDLLKKAELEKWDIKKYWSVLFNSSTLAKTLRIIFENVRSMKSTHFMLNHNTPISIQLSTAPLLLRKATSIAAAQSWSYFRHKHYFDNSRPTLVSEYSSKISSTDISDFMNCKNAEKLKSESSMIFMSSSNYNLNIKPLPGGVIGKLSESQKNLYGLGLDVPENNKHILQDIDGQLGNSDSENRIQISSDIDFHSMNNEDFSGTVIGSGSKKIVSLIKRRPDYDLNSTINLLSHLEAKSKKIDKESDINKLFGTSDNVIGAQSELNIKNGKTRNKKRISYDFYPENMFDPDHGSDTSNLDHMLYNYRKLVTSSEFTNPLSPSTQGPTRNIVSTGELLPSNLSLYPTIEPYHSLLLLSHPDSLIKRMGSDASPSLIKLIYEASPTKNLDELHHVVDVSFAQICRLSAHLVYWGEARIVCPVSTSNIYMIGPKVEISRAIKNYSEDFARKFSGYSLPVVLSKLHKHESFKQLMGSIINVGTEDYFKGENVCDSQNLDVPIPETSNSSSFTVALSDSETNFTDDSKARIKSLLSMISQQNNELLEQQKRKDEEKEQPNLDLHRNTSSSKDLLALGYEDRSFEYSHKSSVTLDKISNVLPKIEPGGSKSGGIKSSSVILNLNKTDTSSPAVSTQQSFIRRSNEALGKENKTDSIVATSTEPNVDKDEEKLYHNILVYLLKAKILAQKHTWPILLVPLYVKYNLSESQHRRLLKQQWEHIMSNRKPPLKSNHYSNNIEERDMNIYFPNNGDNNIGHVDSDKLLKTNRFDHNETSTGFSLGEEFYDLKKQKTGGYIDNYYYSWRPTSGYAFATPSERNYLEKLVEKEHPRYARWFLNKSFYFNGKHHLDEILFREYLTPKQFEQMMIPFKDLVIMLHHY
ncbi:hypothetical protein BB559_001122 [Furculomyces boomerangus]|uniref:Nitrogen permease regulator 3 n=1 Tax=Furculomyces boomerangus TaxID=61424 RepID=A0A2T9Z322_9FUNG|nr:hypothetical protein BB559_001122 [Furculomyces boomerangus]